MREAVHSFFFTPGYGGLLVCVIVTALVVIYVNLALWIRAGADVQDPDEE